jgi:hypothetical protein
MMDLLKRFFPKNKIETANNGSMTRPVGKPSMTDRLLHGMPSAYAYGRHTRDPIEFHKSGSEYGIPFVTRGKLLGQHISNPLGEDMIDISLDQPEPEIHRSIKHEELHHAMPFGMSPDGQHAYIEPALEDTRVRDVLLRVLPKSINGDLYRKIPGVK